MYGGYSTTEQDSILHTVRKPQNSSGKISPPHCNLLGFLPPGQAVHISCSMHVYIYMVMELKGTAITKQ